MSMSRNLGTMDARLVGHINLDYIWKAGVRLPAGIETCILGVDGTILHCPNPDFARPLLSRLERAKWPHRGTLEWAANGRTYRAAYTNLFLEPNFETSGWTVVVVESTAAAATLAKDFVWTFSSLIIFSLGLVFMLGQYLIRRNMGPIEVLQDATGRIAEGEFGHSVNIESGDEFEDLGRAFNEMSRRLEEGQKLLVRTARMGTMGQMASGFVHEVRQPLSAMMGHVQLVMFKDRDPDTLESLETVLGAIEDLDKIISRFRTFSQETPMEKVTLNLNDVVQEVYRLLAIRFTKRSIECRLELHDDDVKVWGDYRSLQQVLSNLMINALDELEAKEGGKPLLVIRTEGANDYATLTVIDNGRGIPEDIREKVFDPFFTTKPSDKGTGLGMAIVESIVHQHGASLELESAAGTTIRIVFPSTPREEQHEK
jgi:signal transduction histidine kinase